MFTYNELKPGKFCVLDGEPCVVLEFNFLRMQQRKPVAQTKIKNLISGKTIERNFQVSDKVEEAELTEREAKYLYNNRGEHWFCEANDPSKRFRLDEGLIGESSKFLKANAIIKIVLFNEKIIATKLPIKMELKVTEAPPSTKGNTAQGGSKQVTLETGAILNVPLFVNEGDTIIANTETGEYV